MTQFGSEAAVQNFYKAEAAYMASNTPDFAPVAETLSEDVLLCEPASLPYGGDYRGHDDFERWLRAFSATWSSLDVQGSEAVAVGDLVFSRSKVRAVSRATGHRADWDLLQYFRIKNGLIAELRPFHWDTAAILSALKS